MNYSLIEDLELRVIGTQDNQMAGMSRFYEVHLLIALATHRV